MIEEFLDLRKKVMMNAIASSIVVALIFLYFALRIYSGFVPILLSTSAVILVTLSITFSVLMSYSEYKAIRDTRYKVIEWNKGFDIFVIIMGLIFLFVMVMALIYSVQSSLVFFFNYTSIAVFPLNMKAKRNRLVVGEEINLIANNIARKQDIKGFYVESSKNKAMNVSIILSDNIIHNFLLYKGQINSLKEFGMIQVSELP